MNNQDLETIQALKNEIKLAGSADIWIAVGVGVSFLISSFTLLHLVWRRRRDVWEMPQVAETFKATEDGLTWMFSITLVILDANSAYPPGRTWVPLVLGMVSYGHFEIVSIFH